MLIAVVGRTCHGLESVEDQVSADVGDVIQTSKPGLMARGVAIDLLPVAKRVGPQCEASEYEDLSGEKGLTLDRSLLMIEGAIGPKDDDTEELSMKAPMSVSKPADLG